MAREVVLTRLEWWLPPLLSVIAGMADLIGFFTLGNIFTAHLTGNLVLATAALVRHAPVELAQVLAIPAFMLALVGVWLITRASGRHSVRLVRLLLMIQFILLAAVMAVSVLTRASTEPQGFMAGLAAMIAVAAMACQYRRDFASSQVAKKLAASKTTSRTAAPLSGVRCRVKNGLSLNCHRVPPATWWTCSRGSVVPGR